MTIVQDSNAFVRFAKVHLPTSAERAMYPVLAGGPDRDWTAGELAAAARVSHHEADQALRRFASAGIVHHTHVRGHGHHYRWHPDMDYLRLGADEGAAIDPVCGMPIPPGAPHTALDGGTEIRFCSLPCLVRWSSQRRRGPASRPSPATSHPPDLHDSETGRGRVVLDSPVDLRTEQPPRQR